MFSILISPVKLLPSMESSINLSSFEMSVETEPYKAMLDMLRDTTLLWKHLMPLHEQTEVGVEEFHVLIAAFGNSNPCLRAISAWKSEMRVEETEELVKKVSVAAKRRKGTIFGLNCFMGSEFERKNEGFRK